MDKITSAAEAVKKIKSGDTVLAGGFLSTGSPETLIRALLDEKDTGNLTWVSNDTGTQYGNTVRIMEQGRIKKVYASYIGANPLTGKMLMEDENSVELVPQGTLAERIRAGGAGIIGFYTPVGVGTVVEKGKEKREIDGREYLFEKAIRGNVALIKATVADTYGNCFLKGTTKNFGALMPAAADFVIAEAESIVEAGELGPELITVPGIFVDAVVPSEDR